MRVRYDDFDDFEFDDVRAKRRAMHQRQREALRPSRKFKLRGPRDEDWGNDDLDDVYDFDFQDFEDYDEDEFDQHAGLT